MQAHGGGRSEATLSIPLPRNSDSSTPPPPPAESIARLKEMGFSEAQVIVALRRAHNDEQLAAEYLLGDSDVQDLIDQVDSEDEDDTDDVHGTDSSTWEFDLDLGNPNDILQIVQTVLSTPALQQGLSNPRVVSAFQEMIQNPNTVQNYLNDPEIVPIQKHNHNHNHIHIHIHNHNHIHIHIQIHIHIHIHIHIQIHIHIHIHIHIRTPLDSHSVSLFDCISYRNESNDRVQLSHKSTTPCKTTENFSPFTHFPVSLSLSLFSCTHFTLLSATPL
jgi:hypothetical protein